MREPPTGSVRDAAGKFQHPALFYRDTDEYLAGLVPFVQEGIAAGDAVAVAVPGANLDLLRRAVAAPEGTTRWFDMAEHGRNPGRILPAVLLAFADEHRDRRVRIVGEPMWPGRSGTEYPACAQHEALINRAFAGRPVTILCPYDAAGLAPGVLADAAATHPVLANGAGWVPSAKFAPDAVFAAYNRPLPEPEADTVITGEVVEPDTIALARRAVARHAGRAGLRTDRVFDAELVITALAANGVEHGGGVSRVRVWHTAEQLICEASDDGRLADPLAGRRPVGRDQSRGLGLLLVNQLADLVRIHSTAQGTTVRAYFWC